MALGLVLQQTEYHEVPKGDTNASDPLSQTSIVLGNVMLNFSTREPTLRTLLA